MRSRAAWAAALCLAAACFSDRVRLDVPDISIELAAVNLAPGATLEGQVLARDGSGVVQIGVRVTAGDSVLRQQRTGFRESSVAMAFSFVLPVTLADGDEVEVLGWARDEQGFAVEAVDTVRIMASPIRQ